jgi:N6-L-threonylcarbamoyladenine synthase
MMDDKTFDFSFSGLKTAVRVAWGDGGGDEQRIADFAREIQEAIVDVLVAKTMRAVQYYQVKGVLLVGGVSANVRLREALGQRLERDCPAAAYLPSDKRYITDNAAMIAAAGYWRWKQGERHDWREMETQPNWGIEEGQA